MDGSRKIGVLLPQSNAYPLMGKNFLKGLKLSLTETNTQLIVEGIGFGADPKQLTSIVQKLCYQEDTFIITGLFGHYGFQELAEFVSKNEEVLLAANLAANQPIGNLNGVYQNSLGLYNSLRDLTAYFSEKHIHNIVTSSCYYESGYGFLEALESGINNFEALQFAGHFITPLHPRENEAAIMKEAINHASPDAVVAFHNGVFAKEHASFLQQNKLHEKYPIYFLPFSCENPLVEAYSDVFNGRHVVSTWFPEIENEVTKEFVDKYEKRFNQIPDFFALLGYENGLVINNALSAAGEDLSEKIRQTNINGPRGLINFNEEGHTAYPSYLWEIDDQTGHRPTKKQIDKLTSNLIQNKEEQLTQNNSGWYNAYLCH